MKRFILLIFMFIGFIFNVKAMDNTANIYVEETPNVYLNYEIDGTHYGGQFGYIRSNDELLYCLEIDKYITTDAYYTYSFSSVNFSNELKRELEIIGYYGYQYEGHQSLYYYMATQELIWNMLGVNVYWTTEAEGKGAIIDLTRYKQEILYLSSRFDLLPALIINDYNQKVGNTKIFTDSNNVLNQYKIIYNGKNGFKINGNDLIVDFYERGYDTVKLKRSINIDGETVVYKANNSQTLVRFGGEVTNEESLNFLVRGGNISVQTVDYKTKTDIPSGKGTLEGAVFDIYDSDDNAIRSVITDENGCFFVDDLSLGNYTIRQNHPSEGYSKDYNEYSVSLTLDSTDKVMYIEEKPNDPEDNTNYVGEQNNSGDNIDNTTEQNNTGDSKTGDTGTSNDEGNGNDEKEQAPVDNNNLSNNESTNDTSSNTSAPSSETDNEQVTVIKGDFKQDSGDNKSNERIDKLPILSEKNYSIYIGSGLLIVSVIARLAYKKKNENR